MPSSLATTLQAAARPVACTLCLLVGVAALAGPAAAQSSLSRSPAELESAPAVADNPLFEPWTAPFGTPPFDRIASEHFPPAFEHAMAIHRAEIDAIADNPEAPSFANTIAALERAGADLERVQRTFSVLTSSRTDDDYRAIQRKMSPRLAAHSSAIMLDADLFARIAALHGRREQLDLDAEQRRVLERTHTRFVRAGAELTGEDRARLAAIDEELATLQTAFSQNVQKDLEQYALVLETPADRAGLPDAVLGAAAAAAAERDREGEYVITLARSSFEPFMTFSERRDLREELFRAWTNRGDNDDEQDNEQNIRRILQLRLEKARLLGHENWAAYRTDDTMAGTPARAKQLLDEVWQGAVAKAEAEEAEIREIMAREGATHDLKPWDWWYYAEKARQAFHAVDEDRVKAYLTLDNILQAQFAVAGRLFGVRFEERDDIPTYHPDVRTWEMLGPDGEHRGVFYGDYFARPGKRSGAWMGALRVQQKLDGEVTPVILNNCNYNKPSPGEPALVSLREAEVIFHEFGHGLHGLLSQVTYPSLSGTAVDFDFVEFPAQVMEHWMRQPAVIQEFARHHETGEPMPAELLERVQAAANAKSGFDNVEFIASAFVDLAFHRLTDPEAIASLDVNAFEDGVLAQAARPQAIEMRHRSPHFRHSFAGSFYAGGYYTYLWAAVLDNDGFAAFEAAGDPFDPELARKLHEYVFAAGNLRPAMEAYVKFRGREPNTEALLRNRGLTGGSGEF
jgi:peptidyl-dipeptidase Dcp